MGKTGPVDIIGRTATLTQLQIKARDAFGNVSESTSYVDAEGFEQKMVMERVGKTLATIACDEAFATGSNKLTDVLNDLPKCPPLRGMAKAQSATFTLTPLRGKKLTVPTTANQTVKTDAEGNITVTVRRVEMPKGVGLPYAGQDAALRAATQPTRYLQSDDKLVASLAKAAVGESTDAAEAARKIERFVSSYVRSSDGVDFATAAEVAKTRRGDCTEYAVLTAAMLRSAGLPAQLVVGVVYAPAAYGQADVLVPHAWVRAWIGDRWVDLDAALRGFDPGHIALAFGDGDPESLATVYATIGFFKVKSAILDDGPTTRP